MTNPYTADGSLLTNTAARLDVPIHVLAADFTEGCISFLFNIDNGQLMKVEVETSQNDVQEYIFTGQSSSASKNGQINLPSDVARYFKIDLYPQIRSIVVLYRSHAVRWMVCLAVHRHFL